jgi:hypothetical protein
MKYYAARLQQSINSQQASAPAFRALEDICKRHAGRSRGVICRQFWDLVRADQKIMEATHTDAFREGMDEFITEKMEQSPQPEKKNSAPRAKKEYGERRTRAGQPAGIRVWRAE